MSSNVNLENLRPFLDACGKPWEAKKEKRHLKILVGGKLAMVVSHGKTTSTNWRAKVFGKVAINRAARAKMANRCAR
jgi:hypothetical protein